MNKILEKDLFEPVRKLLENLGYDVKGEVKGCDITAVKDDTLIIIEMKRSFNVELVFQAINRQKTADGVYVAIPRPNKGYATKRWKNTLELAKRLEIGVIVVAFTEAEPIAQIAHHPKEYIFRKAKPKKRISILQEHTSRTGNHNTGGVNKTKLMTAYREQALHIAAMLDVHGECTPKDLKEYGTCGKTSDILYRNYYKWFEKNEKRYRLSEEGRSALEMYSDLTNHYKQL